MPISSNAYICTRYLQRLNTALRSQTLRKTHRSVHSSSISTQQAERPIAKHHDDNSSDPATSADQPGRRSDTSPRSQGWRTLLRNKALGQAASVLVIRDAEGKRNRLMELKDENVTEASTDNELNAAKILSYLRAQKIDPEQSEVNASIESLRPEAERHSPDEPLSVAQEDYENIVKQLSEGFSQIQLARYVTSQISHDGGIEGRRKGKAAHAEHSMRVSEWKPLNFLASSRGEKGRIPTRGKRGLAESIFRSIWRLDVRIEIEGSGTLEIRMDPQRLSMSLFGDKEHELSELGRIRNVKIEVFRSKGILLITAGKTACEETANEIEYLFKEPVVLEIDLQPIKGLSRDKGEHRIRRRVLDMIADYSKCSIEYAPRMEKVTVRAKERSDVGTFQRMLIAYFELPMRQKSITLTSRDIDETRLIAQDTERAWPSKAFSATKFGRFSTAFPVASGIHGAPKQMSAPKAWPEIVRSQAQHHLQQSALFAIDQSRLAEHHSPIQVTPNADGSSDKKSSWNLTPRSCISAHFGHFLFPMATKDPIEPILFKDVAKSTRHPLLAPSISGLSYMLEQRVNVSHNENLEALSSERDIVRRKRLTVGFVPSPWNVSRAALRGIPNLNIDLSTHDSNNAGQDFRINSAHLLLGSRQVNFLMPNMGLDLQLRRADFLELNVSEFDRHLEDYVHNLYDLSVEDGELRQLRVPISLSLPIPAATINPKILKEEACFAEAVGIGDPDVMVDFFATSFQHMSTLSFPFRSQELLYKHILDDEFGESWETIEMSDGAFLNANHEEQQLEKRIGILLEDAKTIHRTLNIGIGKTSKVGRAAKEKR